MASNLKKNLEDQVTCSICQEHFRDPRLLPCLHTYCKQCLTDLVRASSMKGKVTCPECREPVQINPGGIEQLKVNFQMNNLISLLAISSLEQDTKKTELMCENCTSNDIAKGRCVDCSKFMCDFCIKTHQRFLETRDHRVMTLDEVKKHGTPAMSQQPKCDKHKGEIKKLYCETCKQLICRDCTIIDHRDHCYQFIDDVAGQHKKSLKAVLDGAIEAKCEVEKTRGLVQEMKLKIKTKCENVQKEIANAVNEQIALLKQKEQNLIAEAKKLAGERTKSLDEQEQVLATKLENLNSSVQFTQDILQDGDNVTILSISSEANSRLATLVDEMRLLEKQPRREDNFSFEVKKQTLQQGVDNGMSIVELVNVIQQMRGKDDGWFCDMCGNKSEQNHGAYVNEFNVNVNGFCYICGNKMQQNHSANVKPFQRMNQRDSEKDNFNRPVPGYKARLNESARNQRAGIGNAYASRHQNKFQW